MSLLGQLGRCLLGAGRLPPVLSLRSLWSACRLQSLASVAPAISKPLAVAPAVAGPLPAATAATRPLLAACTPQVLPSCGMKMRRALRRRCKHCYLVARHQRWYIMCPVHPRHKQMSLISHPKTQWILSDVMQTPRRPW